MSTRRRLLPRRPRSQARPGKRPAPGRVGLMLYVVLGLTLAVLAAKPQLTSFFSAGREVTVELPTTYKLREFDSSVKLAGLGIGSVVDLEDTEQGTVRVTMKLDEDALDSLGSRPTAQVEPRTVLGGRYAIMLTPGGSGEFDGTVVAAAQTDPTELDAVLEALPSTTREALQGLAAEAPPTLRRSREPLGDLLETAPEVLEPGTDVVGALRGTRPGKDLAPLVRNLSRTTTALTARDGQLDEIVADLAVTARVLDKNAPALSATLEDLPTTVRTTRAGISGLDTSVGELRSTARKLRPSAPKVTKLVRELGPALTELRPVLDDLRPVLRDARPAVRELVPTARRGTQVLDDLNGPVLERVKGPVASFVLNPWKGTGPYAKSASGYQADHKFYEELAYMATNIDRASMTQDQRGSTLAFQAGVGVESVTDGLPFSLESLLELALRDAGVAPGKRRSLLEKVGLVR